MLAEETTTDTPGGISPSGDKPTPREIIFSWWAKNIQPRETNSRAKALSAILRRQDSRKSLSQPEVFDLVEALDMSGPREIETVLRMVHVLSHVRVHTKAPLPVRLKDKMSRLRFSILQDAKGDELTGLITRAVAMAGQTCNVSSLGSDLLHWGSNRRHVRWYEQYFSKGEPEKKAG